MSKYQNKVLLSLLLIINWFFAHGQTGGADRYINWHSAQIIKHAQTDEDLKKLKKDYIKKYPNGLDHAAYNNFVEKIRLAENYYRPRATKTVVFQELVNTGSDYLIPKGIKGFAIKVSRSLLKKEIDFRDIESRRLITLKAQVKQIIASRLVFRGNYSTDETLKRLEEEKSGKDLKELFGETIFEEGKKEYISNSQNNKAITPIDYDKSVSEIINHNKDYDTATSETLATIIKAEQLNQKAAEELKTKIISNNKKIDEYKKNVDNLESQGKDFKSELTEIKKLTMQNELHIQALRIAVQDNTEDLHVIKKDIIKIKDDVNQLKNDVSALKLKQEWDELPLVEKVQILKTSDRFDSYFKAGEKSSTIEIYEAIVFREKVVKTCNDINAYGSVAISAMERFDIGSPALRKGFQYALTGASVIGNIYSQNYAAAAQSVLSLFGNGGLSQESKMLQQVQTQLDMMYNDMKLEFGHLNKHLNVLENNINIRFDYVQRQLDLISSQLYQMQVLNLENFALVIQKLDFIQKQNSCIQEDLHTQFSTYQRCETFYNYKIDDKVTINELKSSMSTYGGCISALNQQMITPSIRNPVFDASDCKLSYPITKLYNDILKLFKDASLRKKGTSINDGLSFLGYPIKSLQNVDKYLVNYEKTKADFGNENFPNQDLAFNVFTNPLVIKYKNPSSIYAFAEYTLEFLPYLELYNSSSNQILNSFSEVTDLQIMFLKKSMIEQIHLCEISIVQNQLLNGMPIITQIEDILNNETNADNLRAFFEVIEINPIFERNLAMYLLCKYFDKTNVDKIKDYALKHRNNYFSVKSITSPWLTIYADNEGLPFFNIQSVKPFQISDGGVVSVRSTKIPVPIDEYSLGITDFLMDQHTQDLIRAKNDLTQAIIDFDLFRLIPAVDKKGIDKRDILYMMSRVSLQ